MKTDHRIQIFKSSLDLSNYAAQLFTEIANQSIAKRGRFLVALSGGSTPMRLYEILGDQFRDQVDWNQVHFFWGDERCVSVDDPGNSYGQAKKIFLDNVNATNIHRIESDLKPAQAAEKYVLTLKQFASAPLEWPRFDLVLLGMGDDGHTASLFPGSPVEVKSATLAVTANYQDRPANRVTLTQNVFNDAHNIIFLISGKSKAETLQQVINGTFKPNLYPAQRIDPHDGKLIWLVDEDAAIQLKQ